MKNLTSILLLSSAIFIFQACGSNKHKEENTDTVVVDSTNANMVPTDALPDSLKEAKEFMEKAASAGMMEVEAGKIALEKSKNAKVKEFAQLMIDDHTKLAEQLKGTATQKQITLPGGLSEDELKHLDDLKKYTGAEFDKCYMDMMDKDHEGAIDLFKSAASGKDADVRVFAAKALETIEKHHTKAEALKKKVK